MKLTVIMSLLIFTQAFAIKSYSQNTTINLKMENVTIKDVLQEIENKSEFYFLYNNDLINITRKVSINIINENIQDVLLKLFTDKNINFQIKDRQIVLSPTPIDENNNLSMSQQQKSISGKVTDSSGATVPGATVLVKGTTTGTITDTNGNYSLANVPANATLQFSFVGMKRQEIMVGNKNTINVVLEEETIGIEEVVAVGYGTQKRREVTGSISNIDTRQVENLPVGQIAEKIQGKVAGVQINAASGNPGQDIAIRIRGAASINAGNSPLYVVDGFPIEGSMTDVNPDEIENISILKGSSAASIYGSRAANGVILITTKRAKEGQNSVQFNATVGVSVVPQKGRFELMNAKEFLADRKAFWEDKIKYEGYTGGIPELYQNPEAYTGKSTNWYDELLQPANQRDYNVTFLSSKGKFRSATTVGYYKEDGVVINSGYQRYSLRSNNDYEVNDHIRVGVNVAPSYQTYKNVDGNIHKDQGSESQGVGETEGFFSILYSAIVTPPIFSPDDKNPDGSTKLSFTGPGLFTFTNWKKTLEDRSDLANTIGLLSNAYAEVDFLKNFQFKSSLSVDLKNIDRRTFYPSTTGTMFSPPPNLATGSQSTNNSRSWMTENTLNFNKTFATNHNFNVLVGYSVQDFRLESSIFSGNQFPDDMVPWLSAAANVTSWGDIASEWSLISMFGRLNYNYKGKYLLSASVRQDGSSRFGSDNQWGYFPSISAGWIISDENFAKDWSTISYLKLRTEYGVVGNFDIGDYSQFANMSSTNYVFNNALASGRSPSSIANSKLTWETTSGMDIGLDIAAFKDRVAFTFDYYNKSTTNMLYQTDIPMGTGFSNIQDNIGEFHFWGYEFALSTKNLVGNFKWNTDFNISFNRNKVIKLGTNNTPIGAITSYNTSNCSRTAVGHPIGQLYGFVSDGVYMTQAEFDSQPKNVSSQVGSARYKDISGPNGVPDGIIDIYDRTFIGNPSPKFIFGFSNTFSYKNFDLNIIMAGAFGQDKMIALKGWSETLEGIFNIEKYMKDRWRSLENPGAGIIGRTLSGTTSFDRVAQSRYVEDASYLTVKNISLGYTLPKIKYFSKTRVFLSIQQALVLTKYHGSNPETSVWGLNALNEGIDAGSYPVPRTFALGVNFNF